MESTAVDDVRFELGDVSTRELVRDGEQRGMRVELTLSVPGQEVEIPVVGEFLVERRGSAFSSLTTMAINQPADEALLERLAVIAADRLQRNFG